MTYSTSTLHQFTKKRRPLFWSTKDTDSLNKEAIVEAVLNYGDWDDVQELIHILGIKDVARIFRSQTTNRTRINYNQKIAQYFRLYFKKYA